MLPFILLAAEAATPKPPVVPDAVAAKYWRAKARLIAVNADQATAAAAEASAVKEMESACGKSHSPIDNGDGGIKCVPKEGPKK
jgi:hypothetical protein